MIKLLAIDMDGTWLPHQLTDQNSLFRYVISSNGAKVTDYHAQKTLYQSEIPKQTALSLLNACQNEKLGITAHIRHEYLLQGHSLVFLGRLIYGKDARKVRYVQNMEQTIQELSCDVKELQFYFFPKTPCRSSKCILQTPRLFVLPTPVSMQRSFHQNPPKGRSDASGPITWYCKIWDCLHRGLRKWSEYVWGFRNEVCHGQCRWDSEKRSRSYASGLRS